MKVGEFLDSNRDSGDEQPEEQSTTSLTPSGLEVLYSWHPKRLYRVRQHYLDDKQMDREEGLIRPEEFYTDDWQEVPSVTTVLGVLDKPALTYWGNKIGAEGVLELVRRGRLVWAE